MPNGFMIVGDKDWEKADQEQRSWMIFHTLQSMDKRLYQLEHRHVDKIYAFIGGIIGGILTWITIKMT